MFSVCSFTLVANLAIVCDGVVGDVEFEAFGFEERDVLLDECVFGLGEDADEVLFFQRLKLDANRQAALEFGDQVGRLGDMKRACSDKKNVVGADHAVARVDGGTFDDRENVALDAFT